MPETEVRDEMDIFPAYLSTYLTTALRAPLVFPRVLILYAVRTLDQVSMWEQLGLASFLQRYWADNQVWWLLSLFKCL